MIEDAALRRIILGADDATSETPSVVAQARMDHYLNSVGEHAVETGPLACLVAQEIMGAMGRIAPDVLFQRRAMIRSRAAARLAATGVAADVRSARGADSIDLIHGENTHEGFFVTRTMQLRHPRFDGTQSDVVQREVFVATDAAIVLPYDPVRDRVLLVEQFRMGPYGRGDPRPWMLEPVAGRVDAGEDPADTARREAREEAGLELRGLEPIASHYCSPGCSTEYFHLFLGLADLPETHQGNGGLDAEHEDIRTHVLSYADAMRLLETGEADNGPLILSLIWLSKERARLRSTA